MRRIRGFTLIELMVVIAIVGIIAVIALPSFLQQVRRSHRAEAMRGLSELQLREERWRASNAKYIGTDSSAADKTSFGALPTSDYYTFAFDSTASGTGFKVKATAAGSQADDTACTPMRLEVAGGAVTKTPTSNRCWN
jgi:type IV pilus assembly protein PilE